MPGSSISQPNRNNKLRLIFRNANLIFALFKRPRQTPVSCRSGVDRGERAQALVTGSYNRRSPAHRDVESTGYYYLLRAYSPSTAQGHLRAGYYHYYYDDDDYYYYLLKAYSPVNRTGLPQGWLLLLLLLSFLEGL